MLFIQNHGATAIITPFFLLLSPNKIITEAEVEQTKAEDRKEDQQYATIKHRHKQVNEIDGYEIVANAKCKYLCERGRGFV